MKRHKWENTESPYSKKQATCLKCGMVRRWLFGDMQGWEYLDLQSAIGSRRTTFHRPECEPDRGATQGFYKDGKYIK